MEYVHTPSNQSSDLIKNLECRHDAEQRIITNDYLEVRNFLGFALGDCVSITDHHTGRPYPQTAQHAIREGRVVAYKPLLHKLLSYWSGLVDQSTFS